MGLDPVKVKAPRSAGVLGDSSEAQVVIMLLLEREFSGQRSCLKIIMECYYRSEPKKRGYRKRMYALWQEKGLFEASEQQVAGQALCIRNNQWLSSLELEEIKRKIDEGSVGDDPEMDGDDGRATDEHRTNVNSPQQLYENNPNEQDEIAETDGFRLTGSASEDQQEILTILKKKLEDVGQLKPVNLRNIDRATSIEDH